MNKNNQSVTWQSTLSAWQQSGCLEALAGTIRGLEKESLRVNQKTGRLAQTPHPEGLGSALKHPYITTDYSEALVEFITPTFSDYQAPIQFLTELHQAAYRQMPGELLWAASMPCILPDEEHIPIAHYGSSNIGRLKSLYRTGLAHRYGALMQTIAGVHYNVSFPDLFWRRMQALKGSVDEPIQAFKNREYFHLIRNFQRYHWWLILVMGASPAVCRSFLAGQQHSKLRDWGSNTAFLPFGTSLRMSELGYQNPQQGPLYICHDNIDGYVKTLDAAVRTPLEAYQTLSSEHPDELVQLNANILQIENEYYGPVRPKRTPVGHERPTSALANRGVEYIEVRCLDVNPFEPVGISENQMRCVDLLMAYCLLMPSPELTQAEHQRCQAFVSQVVYEGRCTNPAAEASYRSPLLEARKLWVDLMVLAEQLDAAVPLAQRGYVAALASYGAALEHPDTLLSAQILNDMKKNEQSFYEFAFNHSQAHGRSFLERHWSQESQRQSEQWAEDSRRAQSEQEAGDLIGFDEYLAQYISR